MTRLAHPNRFLRNAEAESERSFLNSCLKELAESLDQHGGLQPCPGGFQKAMGWGDHDDSNQAPSGTSFWKNQLWGFYLQKKSKDVHSSALVLQTFLDDEDDEVVTRRFAFAHRQEPSLTWEVALLVAGGFKCFLFTIETGLIIRNMTSRFFTF